MNKLTREQLMKVEELLAVNDHIADIAEYENAEANLGLCSTMFHEEVRLAARKYNVIWGQLCEGTE